VTESSHDTRAGRADDGAAMKTETAFPLRRPWPVKAMLIWLIDACAIVVLSLVMLVVKEFKSSPTKTAGH
jgi:hypothetical protein